MTTARVFWNVSHCQQQQSYSGPHSPLRSHFTFLCNDSRFQTIHCIINSVVSLATLASDTWFPPAYRRELKQRRRERQRERQKSNWLRLAKQELCTCITLFWTFLCRRCTGTTWKYLNSRSVEDGSTRQQLSFSFPELWYSPLEFNSEKICQHLTN